MSVIEIVAYTPVDMDKFIDFCIHGKPNGTGGYLTDSQGRKITGAFDWLRGRGVAEAHFFHSEKGQDVNLFVATVERKETGNVPWMKDLPGLEVMVTTEGFLGKTPKFASLSDLLTLVRSDAKLDGIYNQLKADLDDLIGRMGENPERMPTVRKQRLLAALRGELGSNTDEVFEEVLMKFDVSLQSKSRSSSNPD